MKWILYCTINLANLKIYVGVHKTSDPDTFDGYLGCGVYSYRPSSYKKSKTPFQYAVNKYGVKNFRRITFKVFENKKEAFDLEGRIVTKEFVQNPNTYNVKLGGEGGTPEEKKVRVYMYDLDGNFVKDFETTYECYKFLNPNATNGSAVSKALRLGQTLHGYQFSKEKLPYMKKWTARRGSHNNKRRVGRYDENNNLLEVFESTLACKNAGYQNVTKALKYSERKCKGYYFRYLED